MGIPDYQKIMQHLLMYAIDEQEHSLRETIEALADKFNLSEEQRKELLPSGQQAIFDNRVGWARTHLKKAGLLETPKRGFLKITERGIKILNQFAIRNSQFAITFCDGDERFRHQNALPFLGRGLKPPKFVK